MMVDSALSLRLTDTDTEVLRSLCGSGNRILHRIETKFGVRFLGQPGDWRIEGSQARAAIFDFLEGWYNPLRRHSSLGYVSPIQFESKNGPSQPMENLWIPCGNSTPPPAPTQTAAGEWR